MVADHLSCPTCTLILYEVSFTSDSQGQMAMVIYEWSDVNYLGKVTSQTDDTLPVSAELWMHGNGHSRRL
jgi:hypothetical protein